MNERGLERFGVELEHHLVVEQKMFTAGSEPAQAMPPVTVTVDFPISVKGFQIAIKKRESISCSELRPVRRENKRSAITSGPDFPINVRRREIPDFPIVVRKKPQ